MHLCFIALSLICVLAPVFSVFCTSLFSVLRLFYLSISLAFCLSNSLCQVEKFKNALARCKEEGIRNVLALRGDPPAGKKWEAIRDGFAHGSDLVRYIRATHGDYFCVCVAGYPEGHPDAHSYEEELYWLKHKVAHKNTLFFCLFVCSFVVADSHPSPFFSQVDAGADLIISQLFYDTDLFLKWVADCRAIGIKVRNDSFSKDKTIHNTVGADSSRNHAFADVRRISENDFSLQDVSKQACLFVSCFDFIFFKVHSANDQRWIGAAEKRRGSGESFFGRCVPMFFDVCRT